MSSEWRSVTVEDIASPTPAALATGPFGSSISSKYFTESGIPVIRGSNLSTEVSRRLIDEGLVFISEEKAAEFRRSTVSRGDLIFTCWGTINQVGFIDRKSKYEHYVISNKQMKLTIDPEKADGRFIYYVFSSPKKQSEILENGIGSSVPGFNLGQLKKHEIFLPSLSEQVAIANFLDFLDDRITLLRETNKTLESIAQAIFKSWFVDFDPVRAKMEGRQPEGMDEATADLFPDSFEESKLGLIPTGWSSGSVNGLSDLNPESWSKNNHPHKLRYVDLANTKSNVISEIPEFLFSEAPSRARRVLRGGDTIIGTVRPGNKSFAFVHTALENMTGSTGFAVLRPKSHEATEFIYLAATQESSIEYLTHIADGAAYPAVRPEVVADMSCVIPSEEILRKFHATASVLFESVASNQSKADTLTRLRDLLLPRLISGQLRLPEAQAVVEEHSA